MLSEYLTLPWAAMELASSEASPPLTVPASPSPVKSAWSTITCDPLARWKFGWLTSMPSATKATFTPAPVIPSDAAVGAAFGWLLLARIVCRAWGSSSTAGDPSSWQTAFPFFGPMGLADGAPCVRRCGAHRWLRGIELKVGRGVGYDLGDGGVGCQPGLFGGDTVALTALMRS